MSPCCICDVRIFPPELVIPAGLGVLPRQALGFPEYRRAMLHAIRAKTPLENWRAREGDDLGLMLIEWWAYVLDIVAFYDQQAAQRMYLRTASMPGAARRLAGLLGYRPRPAVAAEAWLAAIADSGPDITVPAITAFQSEPFGAEPPQIFETDADSVVSWRKNRWTVAPVRRTDAIEGELLFDLPSLRLTKESWAIFSWNNERHAAKVVDIQPFRALDGVTYARVTARPDPEIPAGTALAGIQAQMATFVANFNRIQSPPVSGKDVMLDGVYPQISPGQYVVLTAGGEGMVAKVDATTITPITVPPGLEGKVPAVPVTKLTLDKNIVTPFSSGGVVRFQFVDGGRLTRPAETSIDRSDLSPDVALAGTVQPLVQPGHGPFLLQDRDQHGLLLDGTVAVSAAGQGTLSVAPAQSEQPDPLVAPISIFGNLLHAVRGETVGHEVLGSGDASAAFQTFKLKKKPLTYSASTAGSGGRKAALSIRVNGILWQEVDSFFGASDGDEVYIVRQNDDQDSFVTFWRLPSGVNNVTARYRFGAGAPRPPAGTLTQPVRPVKGVRVVNPVAAFGGADADAPGDIQRNAPSVALTLGRAISPVDFEALARSFGAVNVSAGWAWDGTMQRALLKLWYIADSGDITTPLREFLIGQADPTIPIVVQPAVADRKRLMIDVNVDPRFETPAVRAALVAAMADPSTGPLAHTNVPIGGSLFRSALVAAAMAVPGVVSINRVTIDGTSMPFAVSVREGHYPEFLPFTNDGGTIRRIPHVRDLPRGYLLNLQNRQRRTF